MANYLVTGGAGFVGSAISKKLIEQGNAIVIIDNLSTGYIENIPKEAIFIQGDCSKIETIIKLNNQQFDAIFHIAGQSSGEISFEDPVYDINCNTISTLLLLQYAVKTKCNQFIYASTMSVYGDNEKQIVNELDETNPKSFYAVGKLASENYLKIYHNIYGINYTAFRYFNVYGPGQNMKNMKQGMVSIFLEQILNYEYKDITVKGSLERFRDFVYIDDVVEITINTLNSTSMQNQIFNLGTGIKTNIKNVLNTLMKYTKINKQIYESNGTLGDQFGIYANNTKLLNSLNYEFVSFEKGIELFICSLK
jgi:UDP-glucose 4-epimerase